jgi:hypothetical protein
VADLVNGKGYLYWWVIGGAVGPQKYGVLREGRICPHMPIVAPATNESWPLL